MELSRTTRSIGRIPTGRLVEWIQGQLDPESLPGRVYYHEVTDRGALHRSDLKAVGAHAGVYIASRIFSRLEQGLRSPEWTKG